MYWFLPRGLKPWSLYQAMCTFKLCSLLSACDCSLLACSVLHSAGLCPSYDAVFYSWVLVCFHFLATWPRCISLLELFCVPPAPICLFSPRLTVPRCIFGGRLRGFFLWWIIIEIMYHFLKKVNLVLFASCSSCCCQKLLFSCTNDFASLSYFLNLLNFFWNIIT